jgi:hypothetical protein
MHQSNITHKNVRIREQLLHVVRRLFDLYGEAMLLFVNLTSRMVVLLRDPQDTIRQLAVEILAQIFLLRGENLLVRSYNCCHVYIHC